MLHRLIRMNLMMELSVYIDYLIRGPCPAGDQLLARGGRRGVAHIAAHLDAIDLLVSAREVGVDETKLGVAASKQGVPACRRSRG